jgi:hypothetical protein
MLTEAVTIPGVQIIGLSYSLKDGLVSNRLTVTSRLDPALATSLRCSELLFLENGTPKTGFAGLDLDTCCEQYRASFECIDPELKQEFTIEGDICDGFSVERLDSGEFRLRFRLHHTSNLHGPLAFVEEVGTACAVLRLSPLQQRLFEIAENVAKKSCHDESQWAK